MIATYPIAALKATSNPATAEAFVDYVLSKPAQKVLEGGRLPAAAREELTLTPAGVRGS